MEIEIGTQGPEPAIVLANGKYRTSYAKTAHGLVRGTSRFRVLAVIDPETAGADAGEALDGRHRGIPVYGSVSEAVGRVAQTPAWCVVGIATAGGRLPDEVRAALKEALGHRMGLVNGLHEFLGEDPELSSAARDRGVRIVDIRRPRPRRELRFWSGESRALTTPRIAVLGTDCALGKRTTTRFLMETCRAAGIRTEMIHTGQTGWLQGGAYGIILDSLPNDFVSGELEHAVLRCCRESRPELVLIEGQSALRNPSGPCGAELLLSAGARGVILQHAPGRRCFEGFEEYQLAIPDPADEIELIARYGARVLAVTLNSEGLAADALEAARAELERRLGLPVVSPLQQGVERLVPVVREFMEKGR